MLFSANAYIRGMKLFTAIAFLSVFFFSCSVSRQVSWQANELLIKDSAIASGHIGISIYEPAAGKYWYNYNADKNFIPASNIKLFTLYAAMKHLRNHIPGIRYMENDTSVIIYPTGDPTFLLPQFKSQPVYNFLATSHKKINYSSQVYTENIGKGWAWDDYMSTYMAQRSEFPIYGNLARVYVKDKKFWVIPSLIPLHISPGIESLDREVQYQLFRPWEQNEIHLAIKNMEPAKDSIYYITMNPAFYEIPDYLTDTLNREVFLVDIKIEDSIDNNDKRLLIIHSQPTDSLLKPMMQQSDNFFAEQTLLMVSNETLGYMSDEAIIDSLLKTDLKDLPQQPRWVDGSGLSRYNLATPKSLVQLLHKIKNEFSWNRITTILPTGGEGTLKNYFKDEPGFIYAKTGTLSNNSALSGYLITRKNKLLIFSVLNNNYAGGATPVRRAVEKFLLQLREKY